MTREIVARDDINPDTAEVFPLTQEFLLDGGGRREVDIGETTVPRAFELIAAHQQPGESFLQVKERA